MTGRQLDLFDPIRHGPQKRKPARAPVRKRRTNPWEGLTDEQRLAKVNAIRVSRGLDPLTELRR